MYLDMFSKRGVEANFHAYKKTVLLETVCKI